MILGIIGTTSRFGVGFFSSESLIMIPQKEDQEQRALPELGFWKNQADRKRELLDTKRTKTTRSRNQTGKPSVPKALSATDDLGGGTRGRNSTTHAHARGTA